MTERAYDDFDLLIERAGEGTYRARILDSPAGQARREFTWPFSELELENLLLKIGRPTRGTRRMESPEMAATRAFGSRLFDAVFHDDVELCLRRSLDETERAARGLRIRLRLHDAPELTNIPWEYLFNGSQDRFLALSSWTPIVRYLDLPRGVRPLTVTTPLRILVVVSSPSDYPQLDVEHEKRRLHEAVSDLEGRGLVELTLLEDANLLALQRQLRADEYHVFHFVGHGGFDEAADDGVLMLEDTNNRAKIVTGRDLGTILTDHRSLRLAILNACEGGRTSATDPFAGSAQSLVRQGVPAVVAMQFEISDDAAITFAHELYRAIAESWPVDAALAEARRAIFGMGNAVEWGTPVLYMRTPDGVIFDVTRAPETSAAPEPLVEPGPAPVVPEDAEPAESVVEAPPLEPTAPGAEPPPAGEAESKVAADPAEPAEPVVAEPKVAARPAAPAEPVVAEPKVAARPAEPAEPVVAEPPPAVAEPPVEPPPVSAPPPTSPTQPPTRTPSSVFTTPTQPPPGGPAPSPLPQRDVRPARPPAPDRAKRRWFWLVGGGVAAVAIIAIVVFALAGGEDPDGDDDAEPGEVFDQVDSDDGEDEVAETLDAEDGLAVATRIDIATTVVHQTPFSIFVAPEVANGSVNRAGTPSEADIVLEFDASALIVNASVIDDVHDQRNTGNQIFRGDAVNLNLALGGFGGAAPSAPDTQTFQITMSPGDARAGTPPGSVVFQGNGSFFDSNRTGLVDVSSEVFEDGYELEASIPWSALGLSGPPAAPVGAIVTVFDNDGEGAGGVPLQTEILSNTPGAGFQQPRTWGQLSFVE